MRRRKKNIVLTGFMGCGKTTVGIRLSYCLRMVMDDTDKMIERREGRSVSDIFDAEGEEYFRRQETALLRELDRKLVHQILSVGGGTPLREENRRLLKRIGTVIYLRISPETVYERLKEDDTRPLLRTKEPLKRIRSLMEERKEAYESAADIIIDVDGLEMENVLELIREALRDQEEKQRDRYGRRRLGKAVLHGRRRSASGKGRHQL